MDLGTTNSVVAVMEGDRVTVITNEEGGRLTPSVVAYQKDGEILVGQIARRQAVTNPENTVFSIKRFMGRRFGEVAEEIRLVPYKVASGPNSEAQVEVQGKRMSPPEISAKVLQKLKRAAEAYLGEEVKEAVITVPAYFNDAQRQATKDAGTIAGLEVKRIVNEPTAAALAYGLEKKKDQVIAVYDFGGGTFDISILEVGQNVVEVISTNGDTHLGGDNIDQRVIDYLISEFKRDQGIDVSRDKMVIQRLREAAEKAKIELSSVLETEINLPFLTADAAGPKHMALKLTRAKLESLCEDLVLKSFGPVKHALDDAKKRPQDIDEVVLVGGMTRMPRIQEEVKRFFGKEPNRTVNPDEVVAVGAALQAGVLKGQVKDLLLLDVTPLSLGIETLGGVMTRLIERNTTIPTRKSEVFSTAADGQTSVEVHVLQGERDMARDNRTLAKFMLDGLAPAPRGMPQIEVTFDIDANGIVNVSARDKATGREQHITITASGGLAKDDVEKKVKEAESHEAEDKQRRREVEIRNHGDQIAYQTERTLKEYKDKLPGDVVSGIEAKVKELKDALAGSDSAAIERASEAVMQASQKMGEVLYRSAAGQAGGPNPAGQGGPEAGPQAGPSQGAGPRDGEVIDAEFKEHRG
ncbi:MAG TPA: molecular chaperone DnaK [Myxococcota bacterium]|nr:molecular chaperone DnaK [Myxococcota bacterium]